MPQWCGTQVSKAKVATKGSRIGSLSSSEPITRRQTSKTESLLVSLLKQEASLEKPESHSTRITLPPIPSSLGKDPMEFDEVVTSDLKKIESKLEKYDEDFFVRKSKGAKKTATKTQVGASFETDMLELLSSQLRRRISTGGTTFSICF